MGNIKREKGVLKLVHPGRHVEIHREPITAGEIMKKNPRHSITRPDVFKYPWVVVKPESILVPGQVFFIVPNITIHQLIKSSGKQSPPLKNWSPETHLHDRFLLKEECDHSLPKKTKANSWFGVILRHNILCRDIITESPVQSAIVIRSLQAKEHGVSENSIVTKLPQIEGHDLEFKNSKDTYLKSCLRKPDSVRNSLHLKVTFELPKKVKENYITPKQHHVSMPHQQTRPVHERLSGYPMVPLPCHYQKMLPQHRHARSVA